MLEKVIQALADQLEIDVSQIKPESRIKDDLGADSLDMLQLLMTIQEELGIEIPDEELAKFITVADVCEYLESRK